MNNKMNTDIKTNLRSKEKFQIKLGLERILQILDILGNPHKKIQTIHIAGTNGKGSTCAMLSQILHNSGYKTALYTSPHLLKYNERIKINGIDISDMDFENFYQKIEKLAQLHKIELTEFEILTAIAFLYFKEQNIDIAIIETGLGGRFDATNVILPTCSIITSISIDHTDRLGKTIEEIAYEKAGIIKPNTPIITSHANKNIKCIKEIASKNQSQYITSMPVSFIEYKNNQNRITIDKKTYITNLLGDFQGENLSIVLSAINLLKSKGFIIKNLEKSIQNIKWHARMEFLDKNTLIDGAHNPSAIAFLRSFLDKNFNTMPKTFFFGALKTKDYETNIKSLIREEDTVFFVEFDYPNSCKEKDYQEYSNNKAKTINIKDFWEIYKKEKEKNLIIITGSLYMNGEIIAQFFTNN